MKDLVGVPKFMYNQDYISPPPTLSEQLSHHTTHVSLDLDHAITGPKAPRMLIHSDQGIHHTASKTAATTPR
jgi:hypothetical protein